MRYFSAFVFALILPAVLLAQSVPRELLEWRQTPSTGDQWNLYQKQYCDGKRCYPERQVGAYDPRSGIYRELFSSGQWSEPKQPPIPAPARSAGAVGQLDDSPVVQNFGVEPSKRSKRDKVTFRGIEITQAEAIQLAAGSSGDALPEDAAKPHLTIAARDKATAAAIESDLAKPEAAPLAERYRLQVYDLSNKVDAAIMEPFALEKDSRYQKDGVVCYLQEPMAEGPSKVLCAVGGWKGPAPLMAAVRRADDKWNPNDVSLPASIGSVSAAWEWIKANPVFALLVAAVVVFLLHRMGAGKMAANVWREFSRPWATTSSKTTVRRTRSRPVPPPPLP